jgi:integrase
MRKAAAVADDEEKFGFAIAAANVVMVRPSEQASEASSKFATWGQLARAWCSQELAKLYPNAGYAKTSGESTDEPRVEFLCKYIASAPLATFNDDDYWRAMRPARERCKTDSTFKAYAQVCRRVLKIAVELRIIPAWPLSAVCKLPIIPKGAGPVFPFLYPEEYARLVRCPEIAIEWRVLWGFIIREGLRLGEAFRIRWEHLEQLPEQCSCSVRERARCSRRCGACAPSSTGRSRGSRLPT